MIFNRFKNKLVFAACLFFLSTPQVFSQKYILNEDFSSTTGTTPPSGWKSSAALGEATDVWHFNNPNGRSLQYPFVGNAAIFDSKGYSDDSKSEDVSLETKFFDCSGSGNALLVFHHWFVPQKTGVGKVEVWNGTGWTEVAQFKDSTSNPQYQVINVSSIIGGISDAKVRFRWVGNGAGWWAIDNCKIYAPLNIDPALGSISSPSMPFAPGKHDIKVDLSNLGLEKLTSLKINWEINGMVQTPFSWSGGLALGEVIKNVTVGNYTFKSNEKASIRVWITEPNGKLDQNAQNNELSTNLSCSLSGIYTIGGTNPDFINFTEATTALNSAGVCGAVAFKVRNGNYDEPILLKNILGVSSTNTIRFESETGDTTKCIVRYTTSESEYASLSLIESPFVSFSKIRFDGHNSTYKIKVTNCSNISFESCQIFESQQEFNNTNKITVKSCNISVYLNFRFLNCTDIQMQSNRINVYYIASIAFNGSQNITIENNNCKPQLIFNSYNIDINAAVRNNTLLGGISINQANNVKSFIIEKNTISSANEAAIEFIYRCSSIQLINNKITTNSDKPAILLSKESQDFLIANNFIVASGVKSNGLIIDGSNHRIVFNSVYIAKGNATAAAITLNNGTNQLIKNNIFSNNGDGVAASFKVALAGSDVNNNNYFSSGSNLFRYNESPILSLSSWQATISGDLASLNVNPDFTSETELSINNSALSKAGVPAAGITYDIDMAPRSSTTPDIGARNYAGCSNDAGINKIVGITKAINAGPYTIKVILVNHGLTDLKNVNICWSINGVKQAPVAWKGTLVSATSTETPLGTYTFKAGIVYEIVAWTEKPNGQDDCKPSNDAFKLSNISTALIGTYTIGGVAPDFKNYTEAVAVLNSAGVAGAVIFKVRDGKYEEQIAITKINGISLSNTVTFEGESGNAALTTLCSSNTFLSISNTPYITFVNISLGASGYSNSKISINNALNITFDYCVINSAQLNISLSNNVRISQSTTYEGYIEINDCAGVTINSNNLNCFQFTLSITNSTNLEIDSNHWNSVVSITGTLDTPIKCSLTNNTAEEGLLHLENVVGNNEFIIENNTLSATMAADGTGNMGPKDIVTIIGSCSGIKIIGNRIFDNNSGSAITIANQSKNIFIANNFITSNATDYAAIYLEGTGHTLLYNSINGSNGNAIDIANGDGLTLKNNIFASNKGYAINCSGSLSGNSLSNNAYYAPTSPFRYKGTTIADISAWKIATSTDEASLQQNPMFTSDIDLSSNNLALRGAGIPIQGITVDIDDATRSKTTPDIGAKNITNSCDNDASVNNILGLETPLTAGTKEIKITVANNATKTLKTLQLNWQINGVSQPAIQWKGNLASGKEEIVSLGVYNFKQSKTYTISAWCEKPNSGADCYPQNDIITLGGLATPLSGIYTIGGNLPDFNTFTEAITAMSTIGICGPVTFKVRNGQYTEKIIINKIQENSATNPIVFESESGDSTKALVYMGDWMSFGDNVFSIANVSNITFKGLGLYANGTMNSSYISSCEKIVFKNCDLAIAQSSFDNLNISIINSRIQVEEFIYISNSKNTVIDACYFDAWNYSRLDIYPSGNLQITNNYIGISTLIQGLADSEILVKGNIISKGTLTLQEGTESKSFKIENNTLDKISAGIDILSGNSIQLIGNTIHNSTSGYGIRIDDNSSNIKVINNFVSITGATETYGIKVGGNNNQILFNSINNLSTNASSSALLVKNASNLLLKNNIIASTGKGLAFRVSEAMTGTQCDYNNYFTAGSSLFDYKGKSIKTLSEWGSTISGDANSLTFDPLFASDTIPRTYQRYINGAGIPVSGIKLDIDEEIRDDAAPDLGADEFIADFGITRLISPTLGCNLTSTEKIKVNVRQFGDIPFRDLKVAYSVNKGAPKFETIPGSLNNDIEYTFNGAEDLSTNGVYSFKIWLVNANDDNRNNDTLFVERYKKPAPVVDFTFTTACAHQEVKLSGTASIGVGSITSYEWDFGDKATSNIQAPNHIYERSQTYPVNLKAYSNEGCFSEVTKNVELKPTPVADFTFNDVCFGETVILKNITTATDGAPAYSWGFADGGTSTETNPTHLFSNSGDYKITLTAKGTSGCIVQKVDTVTVFNQIRANVKVSSDTAKVTPTGGKAPYTIEWSNGEAGEKVSGMKNGTYSVTVSDAMSCSSTETFKIDLPKLVYSMSHADASCPTCNDGTASVTVTGGVKPYYYQWSNGKNTKDVSSLAPGKYYVIIYDAYLNGVRDSITIAALSGPEPTAPTVQASEIVTSNQQGGAIDLTWKRGNGKACSVFMHVGIASNPTPVNLVSYAANANLGQGDQIGQSGWFCASNGINNNVTITGLSAQTDYAVMVFEYNGGSGQEKYLTTAANGNPITFKLSSQKQDQTITFNSLNSVKVGDTNFALTAKASSGLKVSYTSSNTNVATVTDGIVHIVADGKTTITASQTGNETYNAAPAISQELVVVTGVGEKLLSVSATELTIVATEGSDETFTITSNVNWHINGDKEWITISPADGSNDGTIKVTATANPWAATRKATLIVTGVDVAAKTITITQQAKSGIPVLTVSPSMINLIGEANTTASVFVQSNISWTVKPNQDWLMVDITEGSGNATVNITTKAKTYQNSRTAQITVAGVGVATRVVTVTQVFGNTLTLDVSPASLALGANNDLAAAFAVSANIDWQAQCSESWLTMSKKTGNGNATITVTATPNSSNYARTATVNISGYGVPTKNVVVVQAAEPFITANPSTILLPANGNCNANITILSNIVWSTSCDQEWITVNKTSGVGNATITITVTNNSLLTARIGTLTINSEAGNHSIEITQQAFPTGVEDVALTEVTIAPNPVIDYLTILRPGRYTDAIVSIIAQNGTLLYNSTLSGEKLEIDMGRFASGIYFIKVMDSEGVTNHKVVKH